jgi:hypothetical protein
LKADQQGASGEYQSYESVERQRTRRSLDNLRSFCKTEKALQSFEKFEETLLISKSMAPAGMNEPSTALNRTAVAEDMLTASSKPRHPWLFGSMNSTTSLSTAASRISSVSKSTANNKVPSMVDKAGGLAKSKTTGNLAATGIHLRGEKEKVVGAAALRVGKTQHTRQISNFSVQAQMNARALRERDERAVRRADEAMRRVSSRSASSTLISAQAGKQKPQVHHKSDSVEAGRQEAELTQGRSQGQGVDAKQHPQRPSVISTLGGFERKLIDTSENRKTSVANPSPRVLDQQQVSPRGRHNSEQRELRRRENRQSSGEILKSMVTGGLKGVRRMGRSLTGRGELEELSRISHTTSGSNVGQDSWMSRRDEVGAAE